ncbi:MAG: tyrosine-type recombinase/integrase [Labedaea sp.]
MPRPPLPIGSWGEIYTQQLATSRWMARAQFRDADGVTRPVKRHGASEAKAREALRAALARRAGQTRGEDITSTMRLEQLAELWFAEQERLAAQGSKQMTTVNQYRDHYDRCIKKALGRRQLVECTVSAVHQFLVVLAEGTPTEKGQPARKGSPSTAVMCRNVLSGMLGYAVIHKALSANPVRDVGRITRKPKRPARALEAAQVADWLAKLDASEEAKAADLPDLSRFFLATGLRISEALAVSWLEVDLKAATVKIAWHMVYLKGQGTVRAPSTKTHEDVDTVLDLPAWGVAMLRERKRTLGASLGPVFPHPTTGKFRDPNEVNKRLRAVRAEAGYPWLTSHSLGRKTVATILDEGGATAREIADQLRHAHPSMTQDVYMARGRRTTKQAAILGEILGDVG